MGAGKPAGTDLSFGLMPATVEEVNNESMAAFLATDGSGELLPAALEPVCGLTLGGFAGVVGCAR